ncbi:MAG: DUF2764 family protein [Calditrichae bacterium]|nr:DUF2764 family protein [Calditrichia bacterium]
MEKMDKYYYIVSQLPILFFNQETFMTIEYFLQESEKWLSSTDYEILSQVNINDISLEKRGPKLWQKYRELEFEFRNDLALWRKSLQVEQEYKPTSFPPSLVKEGNPLEVERRLLKRRWDFIDGMEQGHHFDLEFIILYYLKLQILHRLFQFNREKGMTTFQNINRVTV